jgi:hypothetical protein
LQTGFLRRQPATLAGHDLKLGTNTSDQQGLQDSVLRNALGQLGQWFRIELLPRLQGIAENRLDIDLQKLARLRFRCDSGTLSTSAAKQR